MSLRTNIVRIAIVFGLVAAIAMGMQGGAAAEDELKCAALLAFVQNARWMEPAVANSSRTVGVIGRPAFAQLVAAKLEGKLVDGHSLKFVEVKTAVDPRCCQVLYLATEKPAEIKSVLQSLGPAHVLTVGEADRFLDYGGAVNLFLSDGHMAFEVSLGTLERAGIEISSRLLRFGLIRDLDKGRRVK